MHGGFRAGALPAVLALAALSLGACAAGEAADEGGEPRIEVVEVGDLRAFALPLDEHKAYGVSRQTVLQANKLLFEKCMKKFGFTPPADPAADAATPKVQGIERRYGLADAASAKGYGYHLPADVESPKPAAPSGETSAAYESVAAGEGPRTYGGQPVPEGGCAGETRRRLAEGTPEVPDPRLGDRLRQESFDRAEADSRVQDVFTKWSECMRRSGFDYADPGKAVNDPAFVTDKPTGREITVAVADVACKKEVNLINIRAAVEVAYQKRAYEQNSEALTVLREYWQAHARNAAQVVAEDR
ncbi:hypothetical protein [Actinoplanes sp. GCM10030250]|uniref:hypothetical protein n=1 Tax=Actinoplanes sp. GCM10030250 TaxID=3273376 RepID=UPI00361D972B